MYKTQKSLQEENKLIKNQNEKLKQLVLEAQNKVKALSGNFQRSKVNVMPSMTISNDLITNSQVNSRVERESTGFALAGYIKLSSPAVSLSSGEFIVAGQNNGSISLLRFKQNNETATKNSSKSFYRFPSDNSKSTMMMENKDNNQPFSVVKELTGHESTVTSVLIDDKNTLSSVSLDKTLKIWDISRETFHSIDIDYPSIGHTYVNGCYAMVSCTERITVYDPRTKQCRNIPSSERITSICNTDLGLLVGSCTGKIMMMDPRNWDPYQTLQLSAAELPISKISGTSNVTVTCFDGVVRKLGNELPLYVEKECSRTTVYGSIIGSCNISLSSRDDFIISGSTSGNLMIWPKNDPIQSIKLKCRVIHDCCVLSNYVGSFITCDDEGMVSMYACTFNNPVN